MAECLTVDQVVVGSTPISHPKNEGLLIKVGLFYLQDQVLHPQGVFYGLDPHIVPARVSAT